MTRDDDLFVAKCLDIAVASRRTSESKALDSLREAGELHFGDPAASDPRIRELTTETGAICDGLPVA